MTSSHNDSENISYWRFASRTSLSVVPKDGASITPKRVGLETVLILILILILTGFD